MAGAGGSLKALLQPTSLVHSVSLPLTSVALAAAARKLAIDTFSASSCECLDSTFAAAASGYCVCPLSSLKHQLVCLCLCTALACRSWRSGL